jgi:signal transduction histidine kinase
LKYTEPGGTITIAAERQNGEAIVRVRDTGMGIPEAEQPKIWDRLYRGDKSRSQRGLGLGLSVVRAVVQAHHGTVTVKSTPGEGSEFAVALPVN